MKVFNDLNVGTKLVGGFLIVVGIVLNVAYGGYVNMRSINNGMTTMYFDRTVPIEDLSIADVGLFQIRGDVYKAILLPGELNSLERSITAEIKEIDQRMDKYRATQLVQEEIAAAADQMNSLSYELVATTDSVSAVVEENTAATEEMAANQGRSNL